MGESAKHGSRRRRSRYGGDCLWLVAPLALALGATGVILSTHYPWAPAAMTSVFLVGCAIFAFQERLWLLILPALMPLSGLAPWTGWITFEELDLLVLAAASGGYARTAWESINSAKLTRTDSPSREGSRGLAWMLAGLFLTSTVVAVFRGFADAGGFRFGWFQGYLEPMNSVRLAKGFLAALIMIPLWRAAHRQDPVRAQRLLSFSLMLGLAATALATVWERAAFPGLLNFSADYRTTGLFWEMHVGGAALDGFLALTVPFALRALLVAKTPGQWSVAATILALAAYACLTTFSRGVYLAIPSGIAICLGLHTWQQGQLAPETADQSRGSGGVGHLAVALILVVGFGVAAAWIFPTSGYRGIAALLATVALMMPLASVLRGFNPSQWPVAGVMGAGLISIACFIAWLLPKGAYVAFALATAMTATALALMRHGKRRSALLGSMAFAGFLAAVAGTALVANKWGEVPGLMRAVPVLLALLGVCVAASTLAKPLWPDTLRWQATTAVGMGAVAAVIAIFGGGDYMSQRFSAGQADLDARLAHWQLGRDMLRTSLDQLLGKGLGRFPANHFLMANPKEHPGDYRIKHDGGANYLTLTGGKYVQGWGPIFRVTQRVVAPGKGAFVTARARTEKDVSLVFEVCEKHLLYSQGCLSRQSVIKGRPGVWQPIRMELQGSGATRGDWYAPRFLAFSVALESNGVTVDLDDVTLTNEVGDALLMNGDFSGDMAHWFFSSDYHHLPWHIKNLFLNVLFDQGVLGLIVWSLMLVGALWRTSVGSARRHPLAPALAASLVGFAVVGLFDSLLDVPRLAWLYYLLLLMALILRNPVRWPRSPRVDTASL